MDHVVFENIRKTFGEHVAIDDLNLSIGKGEFLTLLGPSGCGKSTTLRILAGFLGADRGTIRVGNHDITAVPPHRRDNGIVFQGYALFPHMTVGQNVAFGLEMRKISHSEIERRVLSALEMVRLSDFIDRLPRQLSGGQQQRVALARAIVIEPSVLLLDEPLSALDAKLRAEVRNDIRAMQQRLGLTTIFVTHDQEEALSLSDRVAVLNGGRIQQIGSPREIYERSRTRFVAGFVGKTNIIPGQMKDGRFMLDTGEALTLPVASKSGPYRYISVRPEAIAMSSVNEGPLHENRLQCEVRDIEYLGGSNTVTAISDAGLSLTACLNFSSHPELPAVGEKVTFSWRVSDTTALAE